MNPQEHLDQGFMMAAINEAFEAQKRGERPFGCVIVERGSIIATGGGSETERDTTYHSELVAIRCAEMVCNGLLTGCTLYSTHEPCIMCAGAIVHSHISRVVWGSSRADLPQLFHQRRIRVADVLADTSNNRIETGRILEAECVRLFRDEVRKAMGRA